MPQLTGVAHITLSVRDLDASVGFYRRVLGFTVLGTRVTRQTRTAQCRATCGLRVDLTRHADGFNAVFDPRHAGADHIAFSVGSAAELEVWEERFARLDVEHDPVLHREEGSILAFADPDGIRLELFAPAEAGDESD